MTESNIITQPIEYSFEISLRSPSVIIKINFQINIKMK